MRVPVYDRVSGWTTSSGSASSSRSSSTIYYSFPDTDSEDEPALAVRWAQGVMAAHPVNRLQAKVLPPRADHGDLSSGPVLFYFEREEDDPRFRGQQ